MISDQSIGVLAREHGFADIAGELAALARPSLRVELVGDVPGVGQSKLGGLPDLPADIAWPTAKWSGHEDQPMTFFAQIALDQLDGRVWPGPGEGFLSFFCRPSPEYLGVDTGGSARVLWIAPEAKLERRSWPERLERDFRLAEAAVTLRPEVTLPTIGVEEAVQLRELGFGWGAPRYDQHDAYESLIRALGDQQGFAPRQANGAWAKHHRILGWPRHIQGDVMSELVLMHFEDNAIAYKTGDLERNASDWVMLLQLQADERLGATFADGGTLFFGLPVADLQAGSFDRAQAISQSN